MRQPESSAHCGAPPAAANGHDAAAREQILNTGVTGTPGTPHTSTAPRPMAPTPLDARMRALRAIYDVHMRGVYRYLYQRVGNREEAEDLTSQVFLKATRDLDTSRDEREISSWLLRVARTTLVDHWREVYALHTASLERLQETGWEPTMAESPDDAAQTTDVRVAAVLERLPTRARAILIYRFLRGFSLQETATALGMSLSNVKVAQLRALRLAAQLAQTPERSGEVAEWTGETGASHARGRT